MAPTNNLSNTLKRATSRRLAVLLASEASLALAIFAVAFCVLLLAGAQVLGAMLLLPLVLLAAGVMVWRIRKQWLDPYQTAQELDRRFGLPDTVSTAWHFEQVPVDGEERLQRLKPLIERQRQEATDAVRNIALEDAFPFAFGRLHLSALAVCGIAIALFGYRYFTTDSLNLRDQLSSLHIPFINGEDGPPAMAADELYQPDPEIVKSPLADYQPEYDPARERLDGTYNDMPEITGVNVSGDESGQNGDSESAQSEAASDMRSEMANDPRRQPGNQGKNGEQREGDRKKDDQKGNSLFEKFQQAVNNMMDKIANRDNPNMEQRGDEKQNQQAKNQGDQQGDGSDDSSDREGNQKNDNAQANENAKQGEGGQNAKQMDQQTNAAASEKASDAPSSVGAEDGAKDLAAAKQMEAMGKIAEILGQRAEQVKGDLKVEVEAQKEQTLQTELRNIRARHSDTGGEMSRDQVPLRLQNYVKEYLKNARQADAAAQAQSQSRNN